MILRRLAQHLREQNWTAISIEFVLLVAGVFLGIQVANWNESRNEAERARQNLERIAVDLRSDREALERRVVFWGEVAEHGRAAIRYAETGELREGSAWKTLLSFYQASQLFPYVPMDTTYQELVSAGEIGLFSSAELRTALADYYVRGAGPAANFLFRTEPEYRRLVRGLTPAPAASWVWRACHRMPGIDEQELLECESPIPEVDAQAVLDVYLEDPQMLRELRFWITNLEVMTGLIINHQGSAERLAGQINEALNP
ncbi:hypothetical protein [Pseudomarimonas salicorniae]|uniref:Uncharacterized protein n=1 Tax=Pseudomarimonas salicorniae TaxID=2933270 RepID=A0ABT0GE55_9GAMM|nr:hypothetical protein [Lysobacter sp. CAU 1642]MCK7592723.1 hypothetical protein [Lysobacter sp. CAU 1642]